MRKTSCTVYKKTIELHYVRENHRITLCKERVNKAEQVVAPAELIYSRNRVSYDFYTLPNIHRMKEVARFLKEKMIRKTFNTVLSVGKVGEDCMVLNLYRL